MTQDFGDFDDDDAYDDQIEMENPNVDWDAIQRLQDRYDKIAALPVDERKIAAKALIRELNGEDSGPILVT